MRRRGRRRWARSPPRLARPTACTVRVVLTATKDGDATCSCCFQCIPLLNLLSAVPAFNSNPRILWTRFDCLLHCAPFFIHSCSSIKAQHWVFIKNWFLAIVYKKKLDTDVWRSVSKNWESIFRNSNNIFVPHLTCSYEKKDVVIWAVNNTQLLNGKK
jgi:hypothetical protein